MKIGYCNGYFNFKCDWLASTAAAAAAADRGYLQSEYIYILYEREREESVEMGIYFKSLKFTQHFVIQIGFFSKLFSLFFNCPKELTFDATDNAAAAASLHFRPRWYTNTRQHWDEMRWDLVCIFFSYSLSSLLESDNCFLVADEE